MLNIVDKYITRPGQLAGPFNSDDGIGLAVKGEFLHVRNSVIDFSGLPLDEQDEACAVTWGASALFERCIIRGAGKLFLCGSGDKERRAGEEGCQVTLRECLLEGFGRRGPEVQCGMTCKMEDCVVRFWGAPGMFSVRAFGAWAHDGGEIWATRCAFINQCHMTFPQRVADRWHHFWQALHDNGLRAIFAPLTYAAGWRRGLTASDTGLVAAIGCYASPGVILQAKSGGMTEAEAMRLVAHLENVAKPIGDVTQGERQ